MQENILIQEYLAFSACPWRIMPAAVSYTHLCAAADAHQDIHLFTRPVGRLPGVARQMPVQQLACHAAAAHILDVYKRQVGDCPDAGGSFHQRLVAVRVVLGCKGFPSIADDARIPMEFIGLIVRVAAEFEGFLPVADVVVLIAKAAAGPELVSDQFGLFLPNKHSTPTKSSIVATISVS